MAAAPVDAKRGASLLALVLVVLTGLIGFGLFIPIFPFLALHLGATATETTIAMGAYSLGQLVASPGWGRLSDIVGRKPVLIVGLVGGAVSYIMLAYATSVEAMGLARLFGGLMAGNVGAAFAAATDLSDDQTRARNMGLLGAAFAVAFIVGPALGALLVGPDASLQGYQRVCFAAAGFATLAAAFAAFFFTETLARAARRTGDEPRVRRLTLLRARPVLARLVLITLVMISAQALMESTFALWADRELRWGAHETGWAFALMGVLTIVLQGGGAGRIARAMGERRMLSLGLFIFAGGLLGLMLAQDVWSAYAALSVLAVGVGLATPALNALVGGQTREDNRGAVMGLNQSASALGRVIGPLSAGALFDGLGHTAPFAIGAILLAGALTLALTAKPDEPV